MYSSNHRGGGGVEGRVSCPTVHRCAHSSDLYEDQRSKCPRGHTHTGSRTHQHSGRRTGLTVWACTKALRSGAAQWARTWSAAFRSRPVFLSGGGSTSAGSASVFSFSRLQKAAWILFSYIFLQKEWGCGVFGHIYIHTIQCTFVLHARESVAPSWLLSPLPLTVEVQWDKAATPHLRLKVENASEAPSGADWGSPRNAQTRPLAPTGSCVKNAAKQRQAITSEQEWV